jgi:4-amino-4-deoxychorismate lyase
MSGALGSWIDGLPAHSLPADDRGLHYGDGLFETLRIRAGRPRFLEAHLARLNAGCARLAIPFVAGDALRQELSTICQATPAAAILKIIVTRGSATRRGYASAGDEQPRRLVTLFDASPLPESWRAGVTLSFASAPLADNATLAGIKHLGRLESVLALREAQAAGAAEAIFTGADGRLVSGAMSNLFVAKAGVVQTPAVDLAGVAGVMRGIVLRECAALGIPAGVGTVTRVDLESADEVFVTNARIGVVPVRRVGEHRFHMDALSRRLADHVEALDA